MIKLFRWIIGYVKFSFKNGFAEDFISQCFDEGIPLRDIRSGDGCITAYCSVKNYPRLHKIAYKNGGVTRVIEKRGLPFILLPLKGRYGFFAGLVCFCAVLSFLSAFVWNVEITGNSAVSDSALGAYLENSGLKSGVMWSSVDRDALAWNIMGDFERVSWAHINKKGATAVVEINESTQAPSADNDKLEGKNVFVRELSVTVSREQAQVSLKEIKTYRRINFFTADIPLYFTKKDGDVSRLSRKYVEIKGVRLPIGITEYEELFYASKSSALDDSALEQLARKRLEYKERDELDGFQIVNSSDKLEIDDDKCVLTRTYVVRRD